MPKTVIVADWMSSVKSAKLGSLSSTLAKRCCLFESHRGHHSNQWLQSSISLFVPHFLHTPSLWGTPFHLPVSIWKGTAPPLSLIRTLIPHLPTPPIKAIHTHRIQNAEFGFTAKVFSPLILHTLTRHTPQHLPKLSPCILHFHGDRLFKLNAVSNQDAEHNHQRCCCEYTHAFDSYHFIVIVAK